MVLHIIPVLIRCQVVEFTYGISPSPPSPFVVLHIIPVLIRCQVVEFTYGISPSPPSPFVVLHIIPVLIRCQVVEFTYGISPSPASPFVVLHIIPVLIRCQAVGFSASLLLLLPPFPFVSLHMVSPLLLPPPLCGASYNTCPHQMPGSGVYIWHPSFSSSLPPPLWCFI